MHKKINPSNLVRNFLLLIWLSLPVIAFSQSATKTPFSVEPSWSAVLSKAQRENKLVLVDAYTTWCGPCKLMDKEVYPDSSLSHFMSQKFLPIKVQFDQTVNDPENIKAWYKDADLLKIKYKIDAFPTFLFVNPDGTLAFKEIGFHGIDDFVRLMKDASDIKNNYAKNIQMFNDKKSSDQQILSLVYQANRFHDDSIAIEIAKIYKKQVLDIYSPISILSPDLLNFLSIFYNQFSSKDRISKYLFENPDSADNKLGDPGFSKRFTESMILTEMIDPMIKTNQKYNLIQPNWVDLERKIGKKYNPQIAKTSILNAKLAWYTSKKDWNNIVKLNIEKIELNGIDTVGIGKAILNNMVYDIIFKRGTEPWALKKGIYYMELLLKDSPDSEVWLDTYANLLYKLGRKEEALNNERKALKIAQQRKEKDNEAEILEALIKMEKNQSTWPVNN